MKSTTGLILILRASKCLDSHRRWRSQIAKSTQIKNQLPLSAQNVPQPGSSLSTKPSASKKRTAIILIKFWSHPEGADAGTRREPSLRMESACVRGILTSTLTAISSSIMTRTQLMECASVALSSVESMAGVNFSSRTLHNTLRI